MKLFCPLFSQHAKFVKVMINDKYLTHKQGEVKTMEELRYQPDSGPVSSDLCVDVNASQFKKMIKMVILEKLETFKAVKRFKKKLFHML